MVEIPVIDIKRSNCCERRKDEVGNAGGRGD